MWGAWFEVVWGGFVAVWGVSTDGTGEFYSGFPGKYNNTTMETGTTFE